MIKEFIPYEQALKLKELGFDEECLAYYNNHLPKNEHKRGLVITTIIQDHNIETEGDDLICSAALWQQAFDWFREEHNLYSVINHKNGFYYFEIDSYNFPRVQKYTSDSEVNLYIAARLSCLKKLIEIVSNKTGK